MSVEDVRVSRKNPWVAEAQPLTTLENYAALKPRAGGEEIG